MRTEAGAIHRGDLCRRKSKVPCGSRVGRTADPLHGVTRTNTRILIQAGVLNDAVTHRRSGHGANCANRLRVAISLKIREEIESIFKNRPPKRSAKYIAVKLWWLISSATLELRCFNEIVVGADRGIAVVLGRRPD